MYSFYATLANNSKVIIHNYQELDLPCATRKSEVGLPIYNLPCFVLKSKLAISVQIYF